LPVGDRFAPEEERQGTAMISEIPLTCPHCRKTTVKPVAWVQQNTFFTCNACGTSSMIDKDVCAELVARLEMQQRL
jgi:transcription elongation factor Elf1